MILKIGVKCRRPEKVGVLPYFSIETFQKVGVRNEKLEYITPNLELMRTLIKVIPLVYVPFKDCLAAIRQQSQTSNKPYFINTHKFSHFCNRENLHDILI